MWRLAAILLVVTATTAQPNRVPPPMFSPQYVNTLKGVIDLEPSDAAMLRERLSANPEDFAARLKLLAYDQRADRAMLESSRREHEQLTLWLVEHHPDSEILASPYGHSPEEAAVLWRTAVAKFPDDAKVLWNAAYFYGSRDPQKFSECAEAAVALAPQDERRATNLGLFYAQQIVDQSNLAQFAADRLERSQNLFVLEGAVRLLKSALDKSVMMGQSDRRIGDLASHYFSRAKKLDPNLDAAWIYPQLDPKMTGMLAPGASPPPAPPVLSSASYRRLQPDAFPDLPPAIASVLRARGCLIPQPSTENPPRNVIHGEFFERGRIAWAVLCSVHGSSSILVFRGERAANPAELAKRSEQLYLQRTWDGKPFYARGITAIDRKFIVEHYRAYGGPKPPPLDHQGIDDAMLEKASEVYYWYKGEWLKLPGSD